MPVEHVVPGNAMTMSACIYRDLRPRLERLQMAPIGDGTVELVSQFQVCGFGCTPVQTAFIAEVSQLSEGQVKVIFRGSQGDRQWRQIFGPALQRCTTPVL